MPRASKQQARYAVGRCVMLWSSNDVTQLGSRPKTKLGFSEPSDATPIEIHPMSTMSQSLDRTSILHDDGIPPSYQSAIKEFRDALLASNQNNVRAVVLFGGLARDRAISSGWSDIDFIVVFNQIRLRDPKQLASVVDVLEAKYSLRLDITQIDLAELTDPLLLPAFSNSAVINAITCLPSVGVLIHGDLPTVTFSTKQIMSAQIGYITTTLHAFREYLIEILYRQRQAHERQQCVPRVIRWVFSIVRASLRLFGIWTHPYADSVIALNKLFPEIDTRLLCELIAIRQCFDTFDISGTPSLFSDIEKFIEEFVPFIMARHYGNIGNS